MTANSQEAAKPVAKPSMSTVVPIVIIVVSVVGAMYFSGVFDGSFVLGPARDIVGTWKTSFATKFNIEIEGEYVGYEYRMQTWKITATDNENIINIEVTYTYSNRSLIAYSGYTPDVSPVSYQGIISGTILTIKAPTDQFMTDYYGSIGEFSFTTSLMEGTWHDHWEMVYEQNVYTATNGLKLIKQ